MEEQKNKVVSYSQYSTFSSCPMQFKLDKIDKLGVYTSNIHLIFGTSMHETIQEFLEIMYGETKKTALEIDLHSRLLVNLKKVFLEEQEKMNGEIPCTQDELIEFYNDGCNILTTFKNKLNKFYPKSGYDLVGIEVKLETEIKNGVVFWGFIDILLKDLIAGKYIIIDLKTSTSGWSSYQKNDKVKTSQMLIYKKLYSDLFNIPMDDIRVEYHILKRKVGEFNGFPVPRISKFIPPHGKPSVNKSYNSFLDFVNFVYDDNGNYRTDVHYEPKPGKQCDFCDFKRSGHCSAWSQYSTK